MQSAILPSPVRGRFMREGREPRSFTIEIELRGPGARETDCIRPCVFNHTRVSAECVAFVGLGRTVSSPPDIQGG
jgi:hypothetical protein